MPTWVWVLFGIGLGVVVPVLVNALVQRLTVLEYERAVRYDHGRFTGVLSPGRYWTLRPETKLVTVDVRPRFVSVPGQEVLTADAVTVRMSLAAEFEVSSPAKAINETEDFQDALYLTVQLALRELVGATTIDDLLASRGQLGERLLELTRGPAEAFGLTVRRVELKDIMFPGELKKTFAQVVAARKEGQAALERARGETAALRHLANAAKLVDGNPALAQLRLLQHVGQSSGNTIVLGMPASATPLPVRTDDSAGPPLPSSDE